MSSLTVITHIRTTLRRRPGLRLSPLLRFAIATATPSADQPALLPLRIPERCCHDLFRCRHAVKWRVGDGVNRVYFCDNHMEAWWDLGNDTKDFEVERWQRDQRWKK